MVNPITSTPASLAKNLDEISARYIQPLDRSTRRQRFIALVSTVLIVACAIIFNQPVVVLLASLPIVHLTMIHLKKKFQMEAFKIFKNDCEIIECLLYFASPNTIQVEKKTKTNAQETADVKQEVTFEEKYSEIKESIEKLINFIEFFRKKNPKYPLIELKVPLLSIKTMMDQLSETDYPVNREHLNRTLLELRETINPISKQIEEAAEFIWPLKEENLIREKNLSFLEGFRNSLAKGMKAIDIY